MVGTKEKYQSPAKPWPKTFSRRPHKPHKDQYTWEDEPQVIQQQQQHQPQHQIVGLPPSAWNSYVEEPMWVEHPVQQPPEEMEIDTTPQQVEEPLMTYNWVFRGWNAECRYCGQQDHHSCVYDKNTGRSVARFTTAEEYRKKHPDYTTEGKFGEDWREWY